MLVNRILKLIIVACLVGIVLLTFQGGATSIHPVVWREDVFKAGEKTEQALNFDNIESQRLFLGQFGQSGPVDYYSFAAKKDELLQAQVKLPKQDGVEKVRPVMALFGPGLPQPDPDELKNLPFNLPQGMGLVLSIPDEASASARPASSELYSFTSYFDSTPLNREINQDGTYYLAVFNPPGQTAKYALAVGVRDNSGFKELFGYPFLWLRLQFWFGQPVLAIIALFIIAALIGGLGWWAYRSWRGTVKR